MPLPLIIPGILAVLGGMALGKRREEAQAAEDQLKRDQAILAQDFNAAVDRGDTDWIRVNEPTLKKYWTKDALAARMGTAETNTAQKQMERTMQALGAVIDAQNKGAPGQGPAPTGAPQGTGVPPLPLGPQPPGSIPGMQGTPEENIYEPTGIPMSGPLTTRPPEEARRTTAGAMIVPPSGTQPAPTAQARPAPQRRAASDMGVTEVGYDPRKGITRATFGKMTEKQSDKEAVVDFYQRIQGGASPAKALEESRANGHVMNHQLEASVMGMLFEQGVQQNLADLKKAGAKGSPRDLYMRAVQMTTAHVPAEFAGPRAAKYLDELSKEPTVDITTRMQVADVLNSNMSSSEKASKIMQLTGESPTKFGINVPEGRGAAFERLTPGEQAETQRYHAPTSIMQTPEGPKAVARVPGAMIPKPPVPPVESRVLTSAKQGFDIVERTLHDYNAMVAKNGPAKFSTKMREALANNAKAQKWDNFTGLIGQTKEEIAFATSYNRLAANLRSLSNQPGHFSDQDALYAMQSLGSAALGRGVFPQQLRKTLDDIANLHNSTLETTASRGFDTSNFQRLDPNEGRRIKMKDGSVQVWSGKAGGWVPEAQYVR